MHFVYVLSSLLNAAASAEVAYRYLRWWPATRGGSILSQLVLGIGIAQSALTLVTLTRSVELTLYPQPQHEPEVSIILLALALLLAGTYLHLIPAWQMRDGYAGRHPVQMILWRGALVAAGLTWFTYWWKL